MKIKKRKKESRMKGKNMGSHGHGARKAAKGKGHRGGKGLSGTGKRADHKKTLITKKYGSSYFGRRGITSRPSERDKRKRIDIRTIKGNLESFGTKKGSSWEIKLKDYKILGKEKIESSWIVYAKEFSKSAKKSIEDAGGKALTSEKKEENQKPDKGKNTQENKE